MSLELNSLNSTANPRIRQVSATTGSAIKRDPAASLGHRAVVATRHHTVDDGFQQIFCNNVGIWNTCQARGRDLSLFGRQGA
jgi:hypothetical protein